MFVDITIVFMMNEALYCCFKMSLLNQESEKNKYLISIWPYLYNGRPYALRADMCASYTTI
jgi:hypothetical protein